MPAEPGSRFEGLPVRRVRAAGGLSREVIGLRYGRFPAGGEALRHRVQRAEEFDALALRYLGSEALWWRILDANPLRHPLDIETGESIVIPGTAAATRTTRARSF